MKLSIIIVSWNVRTDLINCLSSVYANQPSSPFEVIVIDNASSDGSIEEIRKQFPQITCIANDKNFGFAGANNQGIELAKGEYMLFLNPDTIVHPGSLDYLITFMDTNKDAGACGPKLLNSDGSIQPSVRRFPSFRGVLHRFTLLRHFYVFKNNYSSWMMKDFDHQSQLSVDQLMAAALLVRKSIVDKIGGFDARFFMYYEEVDLCYRIKQDGWQIVFLPQVAITHLGGRSSRQIPNAKRIMMLASVLKFFRKHRGTAVSFFFDCIFKPGIILKEIADTIADGAVYVFSTVSFDKKKRKRAGAKISNSFLFLLKFLTVMFKL